MYSNKDLLTSLSERLKDLIFNLDKLNHGEDCHEDHLAKLLYDISNYSLMYQKDCFD